MTPDRGRTRIFRDTAMGYSFVTPDRAIRSTSEPKQALSSAYSVWKMVRFSIIGPWRLRHYSILSDVMTYLRLESLRSF